MRETAVWLELATSSTGGEEAVIYVEMIKTNNTVQPVFDLSMSMLAYSYYKNK